MSCCNFPGDGLFSLVFFLIRMKQISIFSFDNCALAFLAIFISCSTQVLLTLLWKVTPSRSSYLPFLFAINLLHPLCSAKQPGRTKTTLPLRTCSQPLFNMTKSAILSTCPKRKRLYVIWQLLCQTATLFPCSAVLSVLGTDSQPFVRTWLVEGNIYRSLDDYIDLIFLHLLPCDRWLDWVVRPRGEWRTPCLCSWRIRERAVYKAVNAVVAADAPPLVRSLHTWYICSPRNNNEIYIFYLVF